MQTDGPDDMTDTTPMDIADRLLASLKVENPHLLRNADIAEAANEIKRLRADRATPPVSEEQIASAIDSVHLFSRVNDLLTPPQIEICRYGSDDEDEIVVVSSHDTKWKEHDLLRNAVRDARARAVLALLPQAGGWHPIQEGLTRAQIDRAELWAL